MPSPAANQPPVFAIVLAAGQGKRMKSQRPKVLHEVCGRPMIDHVLEALKQAGVEKVYAVVGHGGEAVKSHIHGRAVCVEQTERLGTGHAVLQAAPMLAGQEGDVIVTCGDTPLITADTYKKLIEHRREHRSAGTVLTAIVPEPKGYGRIVRRDKESVQKIVEEKDATDIQRRIAEVNVGTYCFSVKPLFEALRQVTNHNQQGEYYLTDVIEILIHSGQEFDALQMPDWTEMLGINGRDQLAEATEHLRKRVMRQVMDDGATVVDPSSTHIDSTVTIGPDTVIEPFCVLRGKTSIGANCVIGPHATLIDAAIGAGAKLRHSIIENASVAENEVVAPFTFRAPAADERKK